MDAVSRFVGSVCNHGKDAVIRFVGAVIMEWMLSLDFFLTSFFTLYKVTWKFFFLRENKMKKI